MDAYELARALLDHTYVRFIVGLMIANLVSGVAVAIAPNNPERFRFGSLGDWLLQSMVYLAGGGTVSLVLWVAPPEYHGWAAGVSLLVWGTVTLALVGKILANLAVIFPGLKIPAFATDKARAETEAKP